MIAQISIYPLGKGASLSKPVSALVDLVDRSGLDYRLTSMGTVVEGEWDAVMKLVRKLRDRALKDSERLIVNITIDERKDRRKRLDHKIRAVESLLGRTVRT